MSYLSDELNRQMKAHNITGVQLAGAVECSSAQISLWTRGVQTHIGEQQLTAMQRSLSDDPHDHARLVLAHLLDEKYGLSHEMVEVSIRQDSSLNEETVKYQSKGEAAIAFLSEERVRNRELNDLLIDMARLLQPKQEA